MGFSWVLDGLIFLASPLFIDVWARSTEITVAPSVRRRHSPSACKVASPLLLCSPERQIQPGEYLT